MSVAHQFAADALSSPPFGFALKAPAPAVSPEGDTGTAAGLGRAQHPDAAAPLLRPVHLPRTEPAFDDEIGAAAPDVGSVPRYGSAPTRPRLHGHQAAARDAHASEANRHQAPGRASHGREGTGSRSAQQEPERQDPEDHAAAQPPVAHLGSVQARAAGLRTAGRPSAAPGAGPALRLLPGGRGTPGPPEPVEPAPTGRVDAEDIADVAVRPIVILGGSPEQNERDEIEVRRLEQLPDPHPLAGQLAQAVVEVLSGDRPITQLLTWLDEQIYLDLSALAPKPRTTPTVGQARIVTIRPQDRPKIRSIHVCRPADGVAEVAARVETNGRSRAVALRLQEWRGRWRCSALVVG